MSSLEENNDIETKDLKNTLNLRSEDEFYKLIKTNKLTIIYFWAPWCAPCKRFAPKYEEFAIKSDISMHKIDIDNDNLQNIAINYGIQSIPTLIGFYNGIEIGREIGVPDDLNALVKNFLSNINEVENSVD